MSRRMLAVAVACSVLAIARSARAQVTSAASGVALAKAYREKQMLVRAYDALRQVAELTVTGEGEQAAKTEAAALLAEIDPLLPFVGFELKAVQGELDEVRLDGEVIPAREWRLPRAVDPGNHKVVLKVGNAAPIEASFTIAERGRKKLRFRAPPPRPVAAAPAAMPTPPPGSRCPPGLVVRDEKCGRVSRYLWQNALADVAGATVMLAGVGSENATAFGAGSIGYTLGSPIVHWSHGYVGRGFGSLGIHAGAWVHGVLAAVLIDDKKGETSSLVGGLALGAAGGFLFELLLDHEDFRASNVAPSTLGRLLPFEPRFGITPLRGGASGTVGAAF